MKKTLYLLQWLWSTGFNMVFRIFPAYLAGFAYSAFQISLVTASYSLAKAFALPCGYAADKLGKTRVVFMAFLIATAFPLILSFTTELNTMIILFFLTGITANFYYTSIGSIISFYKKKTEGLFRLEAVYQLGFFVGPVVGGFFAAQYSMILAFYTWALLSFIAFIFSSIFLRRAQFKDSRFGGGVMETLRKNKGSFVSNMLIGSFLTGFLFAVNNLAIPLYAVSLGMNLFDVGIIMAFSALISAFGFYFLSSRLESLGLFKALILSMALTGIPYLFMGFAGEIVLITTLSGIFFIGRAGGLNIARSYISQNTGENQRATGISLVDTFHFLGAFIGPIFAGLVLDFFSFETVFLSISLLSSLGIAVVLVSRLFK